MRTLLTRQKLQKFLRDHRIETQAEYKRLRKRLLAEEHPIAAQLPALEKRDFTRMGCNWYELRGVAPAGRGSWRARAKHPSFRLYESYCAARDSARRGRFRNQSDYRLRRVAHDPRLPIDPEARWPAEFARDGWPGYLGTGASNRELAGLVAQCDAWQVLGLSHARWKNLLEKKRIAPVARRARRNADELYFRVTDIVALARALGVSQRGVAALERRLRQRAYGLRPGTH